MGLQTKQMSTSQHRKRPSRERELVVERRGGERRGERQRRDDRYHNHYHHRDELRQQTHQQHHRLGKSDEVKHERPSARFEKPPVTVKVDREKTCPFLVRVFHKEGGSHRIEEFDGGKVPDEEVQIYSWMDANLRELSEHIQRDLESSRKRDTHLEFSLLYPEFSGSFRRKFLGTVKVGTMSSDDLKSLQSLRYQIGDFISLAIVHPSESTNPNDQPYSQRDRRPRRTSRSPDKR